MLNKLRHFYFNKYFISHFSKDLYYLSYSFDFKALWFRVPKVATRTINQHFIDNSTKHGYIYSSKVGYIPSMYKNYYKFAFVRNPLDRFISAWKNKVIEENYFNFDMIEYSKMKNFDEFVQWVSKQDILKADPHLLPQYKLIDLENLDYLGKFETFKEDFAKVTKEMGLPIDEIYHKNLSSKVKLDFSTISIKLVKEIYSKDYELFNY
jgi:sulfotransferase famil protein